MTSLQTQIPSEFRGPSNSEWQLSETMVRKAGETCSCRYRKEKKRGCKIPQPSAVDKASLLSGYVRHGPEISVEADLELCAVSTARNGSPSPPPAPRHAAWCLLRWCRLSQREERRRAIPHSQLWCGSSMWVPLKLIANCSCCKNLPMVAR
jgi:hypothetical protein